MLVYVRIECKSDYEYYYNLDSTSTLAIDVL